MSLTFDQFKLEEGVDASGNCFDYVELFDGGDESAPSFGQFCGSLKGRLNDTFKSSGPVLLVTFHTDRVNSASGFKASYEAVSSLQKPKIFSNNTVDLHLTAEGKIVLNGDVLFGMNPMSLRGVLAKLNDSVQLSHEHNDVQSNSLNQAFNFSAALQNDLRALNASQMDQKELIRLLNSSHLLQKLVIDELSNRIAQLEPLKAALALLQSTMANQASDIRSLQANAAELAANASATRKMQEDIKTKNNAQDSLIASLQANSAQLQSSVSVLPTVQARIGELESKQKALGQRANATEKSVAGLATSIQNTSSYLTFVIGARITEINETVTNTVAKSLADVSKNVAQHSNQIQSLQGNLSHANGQLANLQARLDDLESRLDEHADILGTPCPGDCSGNGECLLKFNSLTQKWNATCTCFGGYLPPNCAREAFGGTGKDGDVTITSATVVNRYVQFSGSRGDRFGQTGVVVSWIRAGSEVLLLQTQGSGAGQYEIQEVSSVSGRTINFRSSLKYAYTYSGGSGAQAVSVPNYKTLTVTSSGRIEASTYDGSTRGVVVFKAIKLQIDSGGKIEVSGKGFRGGPQRQKGTWIGYTGESYTFSGYTQKGNNANNGGGGGSSYCSCGESAGSGSYGTVGLNPTGRSCSKQPHGQNGNTYGDSALTKIYLGSGGGGGCRNDYSCEYPDGENGGGMVFVEADTAILNGNIVSDGNDVSVGSSSRCDDTIGGAGSGGSIYFRARTLSSGNSNLGLVFSVNGGSRTYISNSRIYGSSGGKGRVRVDYSTLDGQKKGTPGATSQQGKYSSVGYWGSI